MVLVTTSWRMWIVGLVASLAIFGVLYLTVIKPDNNAANQALRTGLQQSQQVINQAKQQLGNSNSQASQALNKASKLTACVQAAGTDPSKLAACQSQFGR